jgi:hypothetical protein
MPEYVGKHRRSGVHPLIEWMSQPAYVGKHHHTPSRTVAGFCVTCFRRVK